MTAEVKRCGAQLLPVDSEHNAIFQVLDLDRPQSVDRLVLTASGGPFRALSRAEMAAVTPAQAVAHPNWDMGAKISVDSATMMNKDIGRAAGRERGCPDVSILGVGVSIKNKK